MWENTVITNAGIELLKNALSGGTITVTAIKSGAGKVDVSALKSQTAVSSIKQSGTVQGVTKTNETIKDRSIVFKRWFICRIQHDTAWNLCKRINRK